MLDKAVWSSEHIKRILIERKTSLTHRIAVVEKVLQGPLSKDLRARTIAYVDSMKIELIQVESRLENM